MNKRKLTILLGLLACIWISSAGIVEGAKIRSFFDNVSKAKQRGVIGKCSVDSVKSADSVVSSTKITKPVYDPIAENKEMDDIGKAIKEAEERKRVCS